MAFIVVMLLSLIPVATSSIYCDVSVDAGVSKNNYGADEPFRYHYMLDNYEDSWIDYTIEVTLTGPYTPATVHHSKRSGRLAKDHFPGSSYNSPWINVYPPSGGWTPGTYQLQVEVTGNGPRPCIIDGERLRTFAVLGPTPTPTPVVTPTPTPVVTPTPTPVVTPTPTPTPPVPVPVPVPVLTPIGIIALVGLLSIIVISTVKRGEK